MKDLIGTIANSCSFVGILLDLFIVIVKIVQSNPAYVLYFVKKVI